MQRFKARHLLRRPPGLHRASVPTLRAYSATIAFFDECIERDAAGCPCAAFEVCRDVFPQRAALAAEAYEKRQVTMSPFGMFWRGTGWDLERRTVCHGLYLPFSLDRQAVQISCVGTLLRVDED